MNWKKKLQEMFALQTLVIVFFGMHATFNMPLQIEKFRKNCYLLRRIFSRRKIASFEITQDLLDGIIFIFPEELKI